MTGWARIATRAIPDRAAAADRALRGRYIRGAPAGAAGENPEQYEEVEQTTKHYVLLSWRQACNRWPDDDFGTCRQACGRQ